MTNEDERELHAELARLQQEHRDLDAAKAVAKATRESASKRNRSASAAPLALRILMPAIASWARDVRALLASRPDRSALCKTRGLVASQ